MQPTSRFLAVGALGALVALAACGGSDLAPVAAPTLILDDDASAVTSSGYGPGAPTVPPGTGTCPNDCAGTGAGTCPNGCDGTGPGTCPNGCDGTGGNGYGPGPGPAGGYCGEACLGPVGPDPADIAAILSEALQEEYRAEMLYRSVLQTFGADTLPFAQIAESEAHHVEALAQLFTRRSLQAPSSVWSPASFAPFASVALACAAGVQAEQEDAAFYDRYLPRTDLPQDVRNVFTNLQRASLENHLPAFELCR